MLKRGANNAMRAKKWRRREDQGICKTCRAFARTRVETLMVAMYLEWKSGQGGVQGWKLLEGFGMQGTLHQDEGYYQLIFTGQMSDSR